MWGRVRDRARGRRRLRFCRGLDVRRPRCGLGSCSALEFLIIELSGANRRVPLWVVHVDHPAPRGAVAELRTGGGVLSGGPASRLSFIAGRRAPGNWAGAATAVAGTKNHCPADDRERVRSVPGGAGHTGATITLRVLTTCFDAQKQEIRAAPAIRARGRSTGSKRAASRPQQREHDVHWVRVQRGVGTSDTGL